MHHRPIQRLGRVACARAIVLLLSALAMCVLCTQVALAASAAIAVPKPTGKLVNFGGGLSVRLEAGWKVKHVYPAKSGSHGHNPYVWLTLRSRINFYAFADGHTILTPPQIIDKGFPEWSSGWLGEPRVTKITTFTIGPGEAFDSGAVLKFDGTERCTGANCPSSGKNQVTGTALALKNSSSGNAASIYAVGVMSAFTAAVQAQVEGMGDSIVSSNSSATSATTTNQRASLHFSVRSGHPSAYVTASGTYSNGPLQLDVFIHNTAYASDNCPATAAAESTQVEDETQQHGADVASEFIYTSVGSVSASSGSFSQGGYFGVGVPDGTYQVCGYVLGQQNVAANNGGRPLAMTSAKLTVSANGTALGSPGPTSSYTGTTSQGKSITVAVQSGTATVSFSDTARCSNGSTTSGPATLRGLVVEASDNFSAHPAFSNLEVSGSTEHYSLQYSISGAIHGGTASGTLTAVTTFDAANGAQISTCSTGLMRWKAKKT